MSATPRLHFLDALRIVAFALLVAYHVGMYYVSWDWHVKSAFASAALEPWMRLSSPWRMSLLFLVSGAATGWLLAGRAVRLRERLARLLKPLALGMVLIVPPQSWLEVVQKVGYAGSYADFLRLYFTAYGGFCGKPGDCLILPTWNHLWFLPYLALYTALAWALLRGWPELQARLEGAAEHLAASRWLLVLPVAWLGASRIVLLPHFPPSHALVDDGYLHAQYLPPFLLGLLWSRQRGSWTALARWRGAALVTAGLAWLVAVIDPGHLPTPLHRLLTSLMQWFGLLAAVGYAVVHLDRPLPWVRRSAEAVFPLYLVHQTVIIVAARALAPLSLGPWLEAPLLLVLAFGGGWLFYRAARRLPHLREWCGLPARQPAASSADAASIDSRRLA